MAIESDVQCSIVYSHGTMSLFTYEHISNSIYQYTSFIMTRATRSLGIKKASSHGPGSKVSKPILVYLETFPNNGIPQTDVSCTKVGRVLWCNYVEIVRTMLQNQSRKFVSNQPLIIPEVHEH